MCATHHGFAEHRFPCRLPFVQFLPSSITWSQAQAPGSTNQQKTKQESPAKDSNQPQIEATLKDLVPRSCCEITPEGEFQGNTAELCSSVCTLWSKPAVCGAVGNRSQGRVKGLPPAGGYLWLPSVVLCSLPRGAGELQSTSRTDMRPSHSQHADNLTPLNQTSFSFVVVVVWLLLGAQQDSQAEGLC